MKDLLDKHLTEEEHLHKPKLLKSGLHLLLYIILFTIIVNIIVFFSGPLNWESHKAGELLYNIQEKSYRLLLLEMVFLIPGYFLQIKMYPLYNKSVVRSAMVPVVFLNIVLAIVLISRFWTGLDEGETLAYDIITSVLGNVWIISLSLFISWYFEHQKKWLFFICLFGHWMLSSLIMGIMVS